MLSGNIKIESRILKNIYEVTHTHCPFLGHHKEASLGGICIPIRGDGNTHGHITKSLLQVGISPFGYRGPVRHTALDNNRAVLGHKITIEAKWGGGAMEGWNIVAQIQLPRLLG